MNETWNCFVTFDIICSTFTFRIRIDVTTFTQERQFKSYVPFEARYNFWILIFGDLS